LTNNLPKATASDGKKKGYKRHFSNYLLDKSLQLRYIGFVTILSLIISGSLGYLIYRHENHASQRLLEQIESLKKPPRNDKEIQYTEDSVGPIRKSAIEGNKRRDRKLVLTMLGVGVGLIVVLSLYLLIMTHKVAGPLYKVTMYFDKMRAQRLGDTWPLRKGDMLKDFYDDFKHTHDAIRERHQADNEAIGKFLEACEAAGVSREGELGHRLDELETHHTERDEALS